MTPPRKRPAKTADTNRRKPQRLTRADAAALAQLHPVLGVAPVTLGLTPDAVHAFDLALARYLTRPDVTGIDIGQKLVQGAVDPKAGIVVRIHVREKRPLHALAAGERIPARLAGIRTDVVESAYTPQAALRPEPPATGVTARARRVDPVQPGVSIGHVDGTAGTFGLLVADRVTGAPCLLSAAHVLRVGRRPRPGDPIVQPGPADGGGAGDEIAGLLRFNLLLDAAIARLSPARTFAERQFETGVTLTSARGPRLGERLVKSGRGTGVTAAVVSGIGTFGGVYPAMHLRAPAPGDATPIAASGDSGAVWYDPTTLAAVGLHVRGPTVPSRATNFAVAAILPVVLERLDIALLVDGVAID